MTKKAKVGIKIILLTIVVGVVILRTANAKSIWYQFFDPGEEVIVIPHH